MDCNWLHISGEFASASFVQHMYLALDPIPTEEIPFCLVQRRRKSRRLKVLKNSYTDFQLQASQLRISVVFWCSDSQQLLWWVQEEPVPTMFVEPLSLWLRKWMCKVFGRRLSFCHSVSSSSEGTSGRSCQIVGVLWIELLSPSKADWGLASAIVRSCPWRCFSSACATCLGCLGCFVASFMLHLVESYPNWSSFAVFGFKSGLRPCQVAICRAAL